MATHSSILAWESPWTEVPGGLESMGSQRVGHDLATEQHAKKDLTVGLVLRGLHFSCGPWIPEQKGSGHPEGWGVGVELRFQSLQNCGSCV